MQIVLTRSFLPSLARCYSQRSFAQKTHLACRPRLCRADVTTQAVANKATGQVISKEANFVTVRLNENEQLEDSLPEPTELLCGVRALLKKIKQTVLVGDKVQVESIDWADKRGVVQEVCARHSEMSDPAMANVDQIILVMSLNLPPFDARQATRFLVSAEAANIPVMLLLNKADLLEEDMTAALVAEVGHWGYQAIAVSVATGQGMTELAQALDGRISAVAGPSGVGKSSIINALRLRAQQQQQQQQSQHALHTHGAQQANHAQQAHHAQQEQQQPNSFLSHQNRQDSGAEASSSFMSRHDSLDRHRPALLQADDPIDTVHRQKNAVTSDEKFGDQDHAASGSASSDPNHQDTITKSLVSRHKDSLASAATPSQHKQPPVEQASQSSKNALDLQHQEEEAYTAAAPQSSLQQSSNGIEPLGHQQDGLSADSAPRLHDEICAPRPSSSTPSDEASTSGRQEEEGWAEQRGSGGVGKGVQLQSVGAMSNIGRGMHTTRHVALLKVGNGLLADTPGFNVPSLTNLTVSNLQACFPEIERQLESHRCTFSNCQHINEPGCCVREDFDRHLIYVELYHEVKQNEDLERHRSMSKKRRQGTVRFKSKAGGEQTREALLETKTHRRVNRRHTRQGMQELLDKATEDEQGE